MKFIVPSTKTVDQISEELPGVIAANGFGLLHVHNLKATMNAKGIPFEPECRVFEVCNPIKANQVLTHDIHLNMALPCRISVWEEDHKVFIGTLEAVQLLSVLNDSPELKEIAGSVERTLKSIITTVA